MISRITPRDVIGRDAAFGQCGDDVVVGHRVAHQASEVGHAFALAEEIREKNDHCAGRFLHNANTKHNILAQGGTKGTFLVQANRSSQWARHTIHRSSSCD